MTDRPRVLIVDDDTDIRGLLGEALSRWGYDPTLAANGREAIDLISRQIFDAALVDIWMPEMDGLQVLEQIKRHDPALEVVMLTGNPMVETAVQALKSGAYDYLMKPLNLDELQHLLRQVFEKRFLSREVHSLRSQLADQLTAKDLVGAASSMAQVREVIARVADADSPVLIEGESGTGKELVAAAIHRQSGRGKGPFVPVNCSAIPADLMESEFFGHVRGAFSGAVADALGLFRSAHGGTLFLDEVAELPPALQAKLLRVLQEKEIRPVGSTKTHAVNARVIAATNKNLEAAVSNGSFRQDLYYRLNVVHIVVPPLRERRAERDLIGRALDRFRNDKEQAARALGLTVRTLYRRIKKFGLI